MTIEVTIPILPCRSITETLDFYRAVGFEVTYQQAKPNTYAVVRRGGIELHFFSMREFDPTTSYSTCYVLVAEVDALYRAFTAGLRAHYGRVPSAGIPRIIPLKNKSQGVREFIAVDPGGNWIRIGQKIEPSASDESSPVLPDEATKLSQATHAASLLERAGQYDNAAKLLDTALNRDNAGPPTHRVQALVARAGLAITMGNQELARGLLQAVRQIPLCKDDRSLLVGDLERAEELAQLLH